MLCFVMAEIQRKTPMSLYGSSVFVVFILFVDVI